MPTTYKILGQVEPATANTDEALYTAPSATQAICSTLSICNRTTSAATFQVRVRKSGDGNAVQQFLCFDTPIAAKDTLLLTLGLTLSAGDNIQVQSSNTDTAFQLFGSEVT